MWLRKPHLLHTDPFHLQKEAVELFPHLRADLLAHLPRIFARRRDTGRNGCSATCIKGQRLRNTIGIDIPFWRWRPQAVQESLPAQACIPARLVEHLVQLYIDEASRVFRSFQVAAHPIEIVGNSRKHVSTSLIDCCCRPDQYPGIFTSSSLRGIHHQRATLEGNTSQSARDDGDMLAEEEKGAQIDMTRFNLIINNTGRPRKCQCWLRNVVARVRDHLRA